MRRRKRSRSPRGRLRWPIAIGIAARALTLCDTTHCQVVRPATAITRKAAEVTSGRVLLHQGQPAFVFYSAWCGGHTELASQVWPGAVEYTRGSSLDDDACEDEPAWTSEVRADEIERALRAAGLRGSRLRDLRVLARNDSERVARIRVEGFTPSEMSGHEFRMAVGRVAGWQSIKSTAFDVDRTGTGYRFRGRGFGHGVGLVRDWRGQTRKPRFKCRRNSAVLLSWAHHRHCCGCTGCTKCAGCAGCTGCAECTRCAGCCEC